MIGKVISSASACKFMEKHANKVLNDDIYAARLLVCSNVTKDAIVYAFRYKKSKNNEEIPQDKRKFVATLDLASGFTTCVIQLLIGFAISNRKFQDKTCEKLFGHLKNSSEELFNMTKKGFITSMSLFGSGLIGERIIVPLLATPLASYIKNKYLETGKQPKANFPSFQSEYLKNKKIFSLLDQKRINTSSTSNNVFDQFIKSKS